MHKCKCCSQAVNTGSRKPCTSQRCCRVDSPFLAYCAWHCANTTRHKCDFCLQTANTNSCGLLTAGAEVLGRSTIPARLHLLRRFVHIHSHNCRSCLQATSSSSCGSHSSEGRDAGGPSVPGWTSVPGRCTQPHLQPRCWLRQEACQAVAGFASQGSDTAL